MTVNINDILATMEAAKFATERVPELEAKVRELQDALERKTQSADRLVDDLSKSTESNAELRGTIRSLEVERDEAGFRALLAEDKLEKVTSALGIVVPKAVEAAGVVSEAAPKPVEAAQAQGEITQLPEPAPLSDPGFHSGLANTSIHATCQGDAGDETKPYSGRTSWQKPNSMTWGDWYDGGGQVPGWYNNNWYQDRASH
jgi:hypothetical protein